MPQGSRQAEGGEHAGDLVPGRYRLTRPLGSGGMGEVHLAHDLLLGRDVAIKLVSHDLTEDPEARLRLLREARAAASLDHPAICPVYDSGEAADGRAYIVMQYVEGETLSAVLARGALSARQALTITAQLAEALAAAHRHGLVHRDVKPANVIITPTGSPKLLDLGIAKVIENPAGLPEGSTRSTATIPGTFVGTPGYMSPEQIEQRPVDGRSDLFSLGALLYETLTGRRAFSGATTFETVINVLRQQPPAPSTLRRDLTDRHDALCERLLAKDPADRFQSAQELVGALRLLLDETRTSGMGAPKPAVHSVRLTRRLAVIAGVVLIALIVAVAAGWVLTRSRGLPPVPQDAQRWYDRGTEAIREGAYITGRRALEQAVAIFPQHVLAYARLAEADAELGDERSAQQRLVRMAGLISSESQLPEIERPRLRAVRALVLRDMDSAVSTYQQLVSRRPDDAGGWLDLGRAQESAGLRGDARTSYEQAIARDPQYAAAYLRLGFVQGLESNRAGALAAFARAEELYRAASDNEGETEVLLRRGALLDALGDLKAARGDLERALRLATDSNRTYQQVRARAALASVTASEGRFDDASRTIAVAVEQALANNLESVAAEALIDLAAILQSDRREEADRHLTRAIDLADRAGARRISARARLQRAAAYENEGNARDALTLVNEILPFLKANRYRRYELVALSIASRAHQRLEEFDVAQKLSRDVLAVARSVKDDAQEALALANLSSMTTTLGGYSEALQLRDAAITIRRRQGNRAVLPYDLANRADLLIRLGRRAEADAVLAELDAGISAGLQTYVGRARRVAFLRGLSAATALDCDDALQHLGRVASFGPSAESAAVLTPPVSAFCEARLGRRGAGPLPEVPADDRTLAGEVRYWQAQAAFERHDVPGGIAAASQGLSLLGKMPNDELRWRLAAAAAASARFGKDDRLYPEMTSTARAARERLRSAWKQDFDSYDRRADLTALRKNAGLD